MTRRILKWQVPAFGAAEISSADEPKWLSAAWQGEMLVAWCEATVEGPLLGVRTRLYAVPTGGATPEGAAFVGTAQHPTMLDGGPLVVHVYAEVMRR
jgi:hypothetical protein